MIENELKEKMEKDLDEALDVKNIIDFHFALLQKTYIKGLNTGLMVFPRVKWHKVSEQVPKEEKNYLVKLTDGTVDVMTIALDGNLEPYILTPNFDFYKDVEKWCEIPEED